MALLIQYVFSARQMKSIKLSILASMLMIGTIDARINYDNEKIEHKSLITAFGLGNHALDKRSFEYARIFVSLISNGVVEDFLLRGTSLSEEMIENLRMYKGIEGIGSYYEHKVAADILTEIGEKFGMGPFCYLLTGSNRSFAETFIKVGCINKTMADVARKIQKEKEERSKQWEQFAKNAEIEEKKAKDEKERELLLAQKKDNEDKKRIEKENAAKEKERKEREDALKTFKNNMLEKQKAERQYGQELEKERNKLINLTSLSKSLKINSECLLQVNKWIGLSKNHANQGFHGDTNTTLPVTIAIVDSSKDHVDIKINDNFKIKINTSGDQFKIENLNTNSFIRELSKEEKEKIENQIKKESLNQLYEGVSNDLTFSILGSYEQSDDKIGKKEKEILNEKKDDLENIFEETKKGLNDLKFLNQNMDKDKTLEVSLKEKIKKYLEENNLLDDFCDELLIDAKESFESEIQKRIESKEKQEADFELLSAIQTIVTFFELNSNLYPNCTSWNIKYFVGNTHIVPAWHFSALGFDMNKITDHSNPESLKKTTQFYDEASGEWLQKVETLPDTGAYGRSSGSTRPRFLNNNQDKNKSNWLRSTGGVIESKNFEIDLEGSFFESNLLKDCIEKENSAEQKDELNRLQQKMNEAIEESKEAETEKLLQQIENIKNITKPQYIFSASNKDNIDLLIQTILQTDPIYSFVYSFVESFKEKLPKEFLQDTNEGRLIKILNGSLNEKVGKAQFGKWLKESFVKFLPDRFARLKSESDEEFYNDFYEQYNENNKEDISDIVKKYKDSDMASKLIEFYGEVLPNNFYSKGDRERAENLINLFREVQLIVDEENKAVSMEVRKSNDIFIPLKELKGIELPKDHSNCMGCKPVQKWIKE